MLTASPTVGENIPPNQSVVGITLNCIHYSQAHFDLSVMVKSENC